MENRPSGLPFDDIRDLVARLPAGEADAFAVATAREATLTKPPGSLGRLEAIAAWLAHWQGRHPGVVQRPAVAVFAGNHGVAARGVSAYPATVTAEMVANFRAGGAAVNQICAAHGAALSVFELALELPTGDIASEPAMSERDCAATIAYGMEAARDTDLLGLGEMGIGNTTIAAALSCALFGGPAETWVGPGTGVDAEGRRRKVAAVNMALETHAGHLGDPLEALRRVGGRELAAIVGAIVAARHQRVPVLLDGYVAMAAAAVVHRLRPDGLDHCLAAHRSAEPGHARLLEAMGLSPLLDLGMRLGEGSGAALAIGIVRAAAACHAGMATFEQAGVSGPAAG